MIQRIQSIWLLLACFTICCLLILPAVTASFNQIDYYLIADGVYQKATDNNIKVENTTGLFVSTIVVALFSLMNIFNFKKRFIQKKLISLNILLIVGLGFWYSQYAIKIPGGLGNLNYITGLAIIVLGIIFNCLALKGIKNDENLLRSADRLR
jgi:hypothetical protein